MNIIYKKLPDGTYKKIILEEEVVNGVAKLIDKKELMRGHTGAIGATGMDGLSIKGDQGEMGLKGRDGIDGRDGKDAYIPLKNVDYFDGKDGRDGIDGRDGKDAYIPLKNVDYFDGKDGRDGVDGKNGLDGKQGQMGLQGIAGPQGQMGLQGPKGDKGERGWMGLMGATGNEGIRGATGPKGDKGDRGERGPAGIGARGPQGEMGPTGPAGSGGTGSVSYSEVKVGEVSGLSFSGTQLSYSVVFGSSFSSTSYAIAITGETPRTWSISNKTVNGFDIMSNSSEPFTDNVFWVSSYGSGAVQSNNRRGVIPTTAWYDTVKKSDVLFTDPLSTTYSVVIGGEDPRTWSISNKTLTGFTIVSNSIVNLEGITSYQCIEL